MCWKDVRMGQGHDLRPNDEWQYCLEGQIDYTFVENNANEGRFLKWLCPCKMTYFSKILTFSMLLQLR
jgi:hypothetical protein